jgi:hypothetical protein
MQKKLLLLSVVLIGLRLVAGLLLQIAAVADAIRFDLASELYTGGMLVLVALACLVARRPDAHERRAPLYLTLAVAHGALLLLILVVTVVGHRAAVPARLTEWATLYILLVTATAMIWGGCMIGGILAQPDDRR